MLPPALFNLPKFAPQPPSQAGYAQQAWNDGQSAYEGACIRGPWQGAPPPKKHRAEYPLSEVKFTQPTHSSSLEAVEEWLQKHGY